MKTKLLKGLRLDIPARGESMIPVIFPGDKIFSKPVAFPKIKTNDIVTFDYQGRLVTHRVIYRGGKYFIAKGDNNPFSDGKIFKKDVIGRVYKLKRAGRDIKPDLAYFYQSVHYFKEIIRLIKAFDRHRIEYVFLKGLPIHLYIEKTHPKRIYADCDILIKKSNFNQVHRILMGNKFKTVERKGRQGGNIESLYFKKLKNMPVFFDVHVEPAFLMTQFSGLDALYPQRLVDRFTGELLANKQYVVVGGHGTYILDPARLTLYLALHIFHHNFLGAFRYELLDKVIRRTMLLKIGNSGSGHNMGSNMRRREIWRQIRSAVEVYELANFIFPVFVLLKKYYKTPVPDTFLKEVEPTVTIQMSGLLGSNIFDEEPRFRAGVNRFLNLFLLSRAPWWKKILVFGNSHVIYHVLRTIQRKLSSFFSSRLPAP